MSKQTVVKATEGHREFGKLLRRVYGSDEHLIVERDGFPVAVLLSYQEYQEMVRGQSLEHLERLNRSLSKEAAAQDFSEGDLLRDVKQTRREIVKELYGELE
jgi:prevent-host-death family protein